MLFPFLDSTTVSSSKPQWLGWLKSAETTCCFPTRYSRNPSKTNS